MSPVNHTIASAFISSAFYVHTRSWPGTLACFLSGIFIDIDHFLDFYLSRKRLTLKYKELYSYCAREKEGHAYLLFHAYELHIALWLIIYFFRLDMFWVGLALGVSSHLVMDQFTNPTRPLVYFLSYRLKHRFTKKYIFTPEYYRTLT